MNGLGLPRPVAEAPDGKLRPVPWSQSGTEWGILHDVRQETAQRESLCLLCGLHVERGSVFVTVNDGSIIDSAPLHDRCATITRAHCRTLRDKLEAGTVRIDPYENGSPLI